MFDYVNKLQLALGDKARRTSAKAGAGVVALIGAGFLIASLWSWLAWNMEYGPALASLIIGGGLVLLALIILAATKPVRHQMPTSDELKSEIEMRLSNATDAAFDRAKFKAEETMDSVQNRVTSLVGTAGDKARGVFEAAGSRAQDAASTVGLTGENLQDAKDVIDRASHHRAAPAVGLAGAFAVGMAVASALKSRRSKEDFYYDDEDDYDDLSYRR
ncbi:phage holin family protein [Paracoccus xiamenensis]|uniref:phage holin family protein n=1 Tax=Paracoccus xiamenensis TaxID=2714901 RepID=UPI00140B0BA0|nr:phage holin family protein [Paracoccus xiamenensis]NHF72486.1 phage holin family protein [Paracoccus xiamenensis]